MIIIIMKNNNNNNDDNIYKTYKLIKYFKLLLFYIYI